MKIVSTPYQPQERRGFSESRWISSTVVCHIQTVAAQLNDLCYPSRKHPYEGCWTRPKPRRFDKTSLRPVYSFLAGARFVRQMSSLARASLVCPRPCKLLPVSVTGRWITAECIPDFTCIRTGHIRIGCSECLISSFNFIICKNLYQC